MLRYFAIFFFLIVTTTTVCGPCHSKRESKYIALKAYAGVKGKVVTPNKEFIVKFSAQAPDNCKIQVGVNLERLDATLKQGNDNNELESVLNDALDQTWQAMLLKLKPLADQEQFEKLEKDGYKQFEEKCKKRVPCLISIVKAYATKT